MPSGYPWRSFLVLYGVGLLGGMAILPMMAALVRARTRDRSLIRKQLVLQFLQNAVVLALSTFFGLKAAVATGLMSGATNGWISITPSLREGLVCLLAGFSAAASVCLLDYFVLLPRLPSLESALRPVTGLRLRDKILAALYGGVAEELIMRLGLFSLLVWLALAVSHRSAASMTILWIVNVIVSAVFAAGHLPAMAALARLTPLITGRVLLLNLPLSLLFGFAYFEFGLGAAILTHTAASLTLQLAGGISRRGATA
jgi:hypothetical protein